MGVYQQLDGLVDLVDLLLGEPVTSRPLMDESWGSSTCFIKDQYMSNGGFHSHMGNPRQLDGLFQGKSQSKIWMRARGSPITGNQKVPSGKRLHNYGKIHNV